MDLVGKLISDSSDIMKREIEDINKAESMLNTAQAEMTILKNLLEHHEQQKVEVAQTGIIKSALTAGFALTTAIIEEDNEDLAVDLAFDSLQGFAEVADHLGEFAQIQDDILSGFQYIRKEVELVEKQEKEMRNLSEKYSAIRANWGQGYDQDELEETAEEDDDWVKAMIRTSSRKLLKKM